MLGLAAKYGLRNMREGLCVIRDSVWSCFVQKVKLYAFFLYCVLVILLVLADPMGIGRMVFLWSPGRL